jgi:hypothetical protein
MKKFSLEIFLIAVVVLVPTIGRCDQVQFTGETHADAV